MDCEGCSLFKDSLSEVTVIDNDAIDLHGFVGLWEKSKGIIMNLLSASNRCVSCL